MIMPCVLGTIRRTFEDQDERAMALGLWGIVGAAGAAVSATHTPGMALAAALGGAGLLTLFARL
ncbi:MULTISPECIES: hypothetical protein [Aeromonas]|uniref:hypothetical protein n=1 Tax=Aeromonas TaxID=642 RepID=UPI001B440216|nr:hypothetical protein [Aeromonas sp. D3]MBP6792784.1 hypothetical protein [Aeromonas sp.]